MLARRSDFTYSTLRREIYRRRSGYSSTLWLNGSATSRSGIERSSGMESKPLHQAGAPAAILGLAEKRATVVNKKAISQKRGPTRPGHQGMSPGTNTNSTKGISANAMSAPFIQ